MFIIKSMVEVCAGVRIAGAEVGWNGFYWLVARVLCAAAGRGASRPGVAAPVRLHARARTTCPRPYDSLTVCFKKQNCGPCAWTVFAVFALKLISSISVMTAAPRYLADRAEPPPSATAERRRRVYSSAFVREIEDASSRGEPLSAEPSRALTAESTKLG